MIPTLCTLAENTFIRDVVFAKDANPILYNCSTATDHLNFETQFIFNNKVLNIDERLNIPTTISTRVIDALCQFCPRSIPEWVYLHLLHSGIKELSLCNLTKSNTPELNLASRLYKIFARCQQLTRLEFDMVELTTGFFNQCILPRSQQYTSISLSRCMSVRNPDVTMLLESCTGLIDIDLSGCTISDEAFCDVHPSKIQCHQCGNRRAKYLCLSVLNLAGCTKLTTKAIKRLVELCGPSIRCLNINQCSNIYSTALWYLCGLFQGKGNLFKENFVVNFPLTCCCDIDDKWYRKVHQKSTQASCANESDDALVDNYEENCFSSIHETLPFSSKTNELAIADISLVEEQNQSVSSSLNEAETSLNDGNSKNNSREFLSCLTQSSSEHIQQLSHFDPVQRALYSDLGKNVFSSSSDGPGAMTFDLTGLVGALQNTVDMFKDHCEFLEAFLHHSSEDYDQEYSSSSHATDGLLQSTEHLETSDHSFSVYLDSIVMHLGTLSNDALTLHSQVVSIIQQSYDDVDVFQHIAYQATAKSISVSAKQILLILEQIIQMVLVQENGTTHQDIGFSEFLAICPNFRNQLVHYVHVIGQVQKEIKRNGILRLRLLHSLELEAIQREELAKIRNLNDQLTSLHDQNEAVFGQLRQIVTEENHPGPVVPVEADDPIAEEAAVADEVAVAVEADDVYITDEEVYDENSPELVSLLKSEAQLLLQHAKYSHCPSCCPYAYTPHVEHLDIVDIRYPTEELALQTLKGFLAVNQGLESLSMSWDCLDNPAMEFVASLCPDLKRLSVQQCSGLATPFLQPFNNHKLTSLDTLGISWLHDIDIVTLSLSSLTHLNLAESNITDTSLGHLASSGVKLQYLNLSWCEEVGDVGLSAIVAASAPSLQSVLIRQCSLGPATLKSLSSCHNLRQLDISTNIEISEELWTPLAVSLPLLRELDVGWVFGMNDTKFSLLLQHCHELRKLVIDGHKLITTHLFRRLLTFLSDGTRVRSAQYAPRLQFVSLQYCNDIDDDELGEIVQACKGSLTVKNYYGDDIEYSPPPRSGGLPRNVMDE